VAATTAPGTDADGAERGDRHARRRKRAAECDDREEAEEQAARFRRRMSNVIACSHDQE
jgi:hypothetical protein